MPAKFTSRKDVRLEDVSSQLRKLWSEVEGPTPHLNTGTLFVLCPEGRKREATEALDELQGGLPCRTVLVVVGDKDSGKAEAGVVSRNDGRSCERVILQASTRGLPGVLLPLSSPDLPVAAWWLLPGQPGEKTIEERHLGADRVVFDSSEVGYLALEASDPLDLAWGRLAGWRQALATIFEPAERREMAARVRRVRIAVGRGGSDSDGWLLAGWLGSRLGWKNGKLSGTRLLARSGDDGLEVELARTSAKGARTARIHSVEVEAGEATFTATLDEDASHVVLEASPEGLAWRLGFHEPRPGEALAAAFGQNGSAAWLSAVQCLREWGAA